MKKTLVILGLMALLAIPKVFAEWWKYTGEITKCLDLRAKGVAKSITEYVCPAGKMTNQEVAFQVVMSLEFNTLDRDIEQDLKALSKDTNKDLVTLTKKINDMFSETVKGNYPGKYAKICNETALDEVVKSYEGGITTENPVGDFVYGWSGCRELVKRKMMAYKESAWLLGEIAVVNSFKNDKHSYMRRLKDQYEVFLNKWTTYVGQLGVIKDKWTSKTRDIQ